MLFIWTVAFHINIVVIALCKNVKLNNEVRFEQILVVLTTESIKAAFSVAIVVYLQGVRVSCKVGKDFIREFNVKEFSIPEFSIRG